jgi:flavin-dependent thymidylate synthase
VKVSLVEYTGGGYHGDRALDLLLQTKNTRLKHGEDPSDWSEKEKQEHLDYMRDTIKSSWEFVDYVFKIEGVTRAFTHQLVRTRTASFAQEAMRVIDLSEGFDYLTPPSIEGGNCASGNDSIAQETWHWTMMQITEGYKELVELGVPLQDARGVLPTNVLTSIMVKANLRTLSNMGELRLCTRTQGEYQDVFREMRRLVIEVHPWVEPFIEVFCVQHGHCAFPRYGEKECPVYDEVLPQPILNRMRRDIKARWESVRYEAKPVAKAGKAM